MDRHTRQRPLLFELLRSLLPITLMGRAMLAALLVWFIDWVFVSGETLFGSSLLKKLCDYASLLGLIPLAYFAIKGAHWITEHLLWRLRRRLIVTYLLIGALPILLLLSLIVMAGYVVVLQASESLVSRHLDGYLEQSRAVSRSLARDLAGWDLSGLGREQLRRRMQERADALSLVFPDLTLSLSSPGLDGFAINVRRAPPEGAGPLMAGESEPLPEWLRNEDEFHGLVIEEFPSGERVVRARHVIELKGRSVATLQLSYPIGPNLCDHLRHSTDLEVLPGQARTYVVNTPDGPSLRHEDEASFPPGSFPIYKSARRWSSGDTVESEVLLLDVSFLYPSKIWQRVQQFKSGSAIGKIVFYTIVGLAALSLCIALLAVGSAVYLTSSITGTVHQLYAGTKRVEAGNFDHEIRNTGRDQLGELAVSFNQMTRSIRELLRVSAEKQRLDQEMRIAAEVQFRLFPRSLPGTAKLDFAPGVCIPARSVSGDYYDYLDVAPGRVGIVVADVCGKGVSAALMMANLQANLRGQVGQVEASRVERIVQRVNQQLVDSVIDASYITLFYAEFDEQDNTLQYTNAGHNPPLLLRRKRSDEIEKLERGGTVLGLFRDVVFEEGELKLESGDLLVAFTDGLIEARNPGNEEYGEERLISAISEHRHLSAAEVEKNILRCVKEWTADAEQEDDLTLVVVKVR
jgi:sigma-B regulation protein RsbU (phosphoserine phosphatase)